MGRRYGKYVVENSGLEPVFQAEAVNLGLSVMPLYQPSNNEYLCCLALLLELKIVETRYPG